jgi:pimeloyl-ACP methyl ester carboxylesterase
MSLPLVFHFTSEESTLKGTLDSPAQGATGIPIDSVEGTENGVHVSISKLRMTYEGKLDAECQNLTGQFQQGPMQRALALVRGEYLPPKRPQEPKEPFPYKVEEVAFWDGDVKLAGTITRPNDDSQHPAVVLVHGSGPHKRDEPVFMHKPFLVLADYLTRLGYVVLRYDKRGVGASTGTYTAATSMDFANDADAALQYLKTNRHVDQKHLGVIGHSEGADIAIIVAGKDKDCSFIVLLAGSALPGDQILLKQMAALSKSKGLSDSEIAASLDQAKQVYATIKSEPDPQALQEKLKAITAKSSPSAPVGTLDAKAPNAALSVLTSPWYRFFIKYDPCTDLAKVTCPVLALNGEKDCQVTAEDNLPLIESTLKSAGNTHLTAKKLPGLNHLFQTCKTGMPSEYETIEETMAPSLLTLISDWLAEQTK